MARNPKSETATLPMLPSDNLADNPPQTIDVDAQATLNSQATETTSTPSEPGSDAPTPQTITLLDLLRHKAESEKLDVETEWTSIVAKLANDRATEAEIVAVLRLSGKSLAELESAVAHAKRIISLREIAADLPAATAADRAARTAFNELKERQKQQTNEMEAEFRRVRSALSMTQHKLLQAQTASYDLTRLVPS